MVVANDFSLADLPELAGQVVAAISAPVILLHGEMGAGKTTFAKALCKALGVTDEVSSPTYSIVNEYQTEAGKTVYHFDFYRINDESEALDFGVEEYLESGYICLLEWPERIENLLPEKVGLIEIKVENNARCLTFLPDFEVKSDVN